MNFVQDIPELLTPAQTKALKILKRSCLIKIKSKWKMNGASVDGHVMDVLKREQLVTISDYTTPRFTSDKAHITNRGRAVLDMVEGRA